MTDFRHAMRVLVRRPGTTLATIAVLALGIGATTVVFSLMRAVLFRPLPYHDPARLVHAFPHRAGAISHQRHDILTKAHEHLRCRLSADAPIDVRLAREHRRIVP